MQKGVDFRCEGSVSDRDLVARCAQRLAPLASLSPRVLQAIAEGTAPSGLTVSNPTLVLPHDWAAQERMAGLG